MIQMVVRCGLIKTRPSAHKVQAMKRWKNLSFYRYWPRHFSTFWNFFLKENNDKALSMYAVTIGHMPLALIGMAYVGRPRDALPYIILSGFLHTGYQIFLMNAYRFGALSNIYPIARGYRHCCWHW